jgi:hypothetical protein
VWAGIGTASLGIGELAAQYAPQILSFIPPASPVAATIIIGTGIATIIARVKAKQPLGPVIDQTIAKSVNAVNAMHQTGVIPAAQLAAVKAQVKGT